MNGMCEKGDDGTQEGFGDLGESEGIRKLSKYWDVV